MVKRDENELLTYMYRTHCTCKSIWCPKVCAHQSECVIQKYTVLYISNMFPSFFASDTSIHFFWKQVFPYLFAPYYFYTCKSLHVIGIMFIYVIASKTWLTNGSGHEMVKCYLELYEEREVKHTGGVGPKILFEIANLSFSILFIKATSLGVVLTYYTYLEYICSRHSFGSAWFFKEHLQPFRRYIVPVTNS